MTNNEPNFPIFSELDDKTLTAVGIEPTVQGYIARIKQEDQTHVQATLRVAKIYREAFEELDVEDMEEVRKATGLSAPDVSKYRQIAKNQWLWDHPSDLPANYTTLYQISRFKNQQLDILLELGVIHPAVTRRQIEAAGVDHGFRAPTKSEKGQAAIARIGIKPGATSDQIQLLVEELRKLSVKHEVMDLKLAKTAS